MKRGSCTSTSLSTSCIRGQFSCVVTFLNILDLEVLLRLHIACPRFLFHCLTRTGVIYKATHNQIGLPSFTLSPADVSTLNLSRFFQYLIVIFTSQVALYLAFIDVGCSGAPQ